jgi:hypothetical protein
MNFPKELHFSDAVYAKAHMITEQKAAKAKWDKTRKANALTGEILEQAFGEWADANLGSRFEDNVEEQTGDYHYDFKIDGKLIDIKFVVSEKFFSVSDYCYDHLNEVDILLFYKPHSTKQNVAVLMGSARGETVQDTLEPSKKFTGHYMTVSTLEYILDK